MKRKMIVAIVAAAALAVGAASAQAVDVIEDWAEREGAAGARDSSR